MYQLVGKAMTDDTCAEQQQVKRWCDPLRHILMRHIQFPCNDWPGNECPVAKHSDYSEAGVDQDYPLGWLLSSIKSQAGRI